MRDLSRDDDSVGAERIGPMGRRAYAASLVGPTIAVQLRVRCVAEISRVSAAVFMDPPFD